MRISYLKNNGGMCLLKYKETYFPWLEHHKTLSTKLGIDSINYANTLSTSSNTSQTYIREKFVIVISAMEENSSQWENPQWMQHYIKWYWGIEEVKMPRLREARIPFGRRLFLVLLKIANACIIVSHWTSLFVDLNFSICWAQQGFILFSL